MDCFVRKYGGVAGGVPRREGSEQQSACEGGAPSFIIDIFFKFVENVFMEKYKHKINYYETDKMGITNHSN